MIYVQRDVKIVSHNLFIYPTTNN